MRELMEAISALVHLISPEKVQAIAARIRGVDASKATQALAGLLGTRTASLAVERVVAVWKSSSVSSDEVASMLLIASHVSVNIAAEQSTELVWTGPTTPVVSARRTEQALLQVINAAQGAVFITSFVAYDVSSIVNALNAASNRGVTISMILELSQEHGGAITFDAIGNMKKLVPSARLYAWQNKTGNFSKGRVHAKVAVADGNICFITSANLTRYAMEMNMEAGVLMTGGTVPSLLMHQLQSLIDMEVVTRV